MDLPLECVTEGMCGHLDVWLYSVRLANKGREEEYRRVIESIGVKAGVVSPCCFRRVSNGVSCVAHGGDFTSEGCGADRANILEEVGSVGW